MLTKAKTNNTKETVESINLKHIAIIMDGNRRWAKKRHLPSAIGHQQGAMALKETIKACHKFGIEYLTVYAFSTENWNRPQEEVKFLMGLLTKTIQNEIKELNDNNVKLTFVGNIEELSSELKQIITNSEEITKSNTGVKLQIAFNYGARMEITQAIKKIANQIQNNEITVDDIDENLVSGSLYTSNIPDPDLLIRTGGEMRISNYLLWQLAYSEIYITEQYWPEFNEKSLEQAVLEFQNRNRRFGK